MVIEIIADSNFLGAAGFRGERNRDGFFGMGKRNSRQPAEKSEREPHYRVQVFLVA